MEVKKADCEKHISNFNDKMDDLKKDLTDFKIEVIKEIADLPNKLEAKFAPLWVAQALKLVMGACTLAIIGAVLALILK